MRYSQSEKIEIIRMVEGSNLSVRKTLEEMGVSRSSFYGWYKRYLESGYEGLALRQKRPNQIWNMIPEWELDWVGEVAREYSEKSSREIACHATEQHGLGNGWSITTITVTMRRSIISPREINILAGIRRSWRGEEKSKLKP
jgi:hypothetical protein